MHHVDIDVIRSQPFDADQKLFGQIGRIAERRVRTFVQDHHFFAHAAVAHPLTEQLLAVTPHVDKAGVEDVAALLHEVIEHDRGMRDVGLIVHAHDQTRHRLGHAGDLAILHLVHHSRRRAQWAIGHGRLHLRRIGLLQVIDQPNLLAPGIQRAGLAKRVIPGHGGRVGLGLTGQDGVAGGVGLQRIQRAARVDGQRLGLAVGVHNDLACFAIAAGNPWVGQQD